MSTKLIFTLGHKSLFRSIGKLSIFLDVYLFIYLFNKDLFYFIFFRELEMNSIIKAPYRVIPNWTPKTAHRYSNPRVFLEILSISFQYKTSFRELFSNCFYLEVMILQLKWKIFESYSSPPQVQTSYLCMTEGVFSCSAIFTIIFIYLFIYLLQLSYK